MPKVSFKDWIDEEGLTKIKGWAMDGLTNEQIAQNMGCSTKTLYNWANKHLPILHALKSGKEVIDRQVENALLKSALGYEYEEVKTYIEDSGNGKKKRIEKTTKHVPPNTTAQIFWLKNRKPTEWRDKRDVEHSGEITNNHNVMNNLSEEELRKLAQLGSD